MSTSSAGDDLYRVVQRSVYGGERTVGSALTFKEARAEGKGDLRARVEDDEPARLLLQLLGVDAEDTPRREAVGRLLTLLREEISRASEDAADSAAEGAVSTHERREHS